jgi:hypothetical protein
VGRQYGTIPIYYNIEQPSQIGFGARPMASPYGAYSDSPFFMEIFIVTAWQFGSKEIILSLTEVVRLLIPGKFFMGNCIKRWWIGLC